MSTIIYTGDAQKCRVQNLMECPACGETYELIDGHFAESVTIGDKVSVCPSHGKTLSPVEEVKVQDALQRAMDCERGHVQQNQKLVKKSVLLAEVDEGRFQ
jgi:ubiquitin